MTGGRETKNGVAVAGQEDIFNLLLSLSTQVFFTTEDVAKMSAESWREAGEGKKLLKSLEIEENLGFKSLQKNSKMKISEWPKSAAKVVVDACLLAKYFHHLTKYEWKFD